MIPFINLQGQREKYRFELENAEREVLDSGCFIGGPQVKALESELSAYIESHKCPNSAKNDNNGDIGGSKVHTVACASGTDALTLALMTLGLTPGDEVIVPDFTFIAPAECVSLLGGVPVFADIDRDTLQISPKSVKELISSRTKGIIAVNLFGQCAPFKELRKIADKHGLWIIEDGAQSFGAMTKTAPACTFGDISTTSFYPSKPLGCYGDGGAIFTANEDYAYRARLLANHGSPAGYNHQFIGLNSRLDALQAAVLRVKLKHLDEELAVRRQNAAKYDAFFAEYNRSAGAKVVPQKIAAENTSTYAQYTVLAEDRDYFIQNLKAAGIPYCIHYPTPLQALPCFSDIAPLGGMPMQLSGSDGPDSKFYATNAEWASERTISLPVCAFTNVEEIIERIK